MCPHTTIYVTSYFYVRVLILLYLCSQYAGATRADVKVGYMCVLILLTVCPHTTTYVISYCYMCVIIPLYMQELRARM